MADSRRGDALPDERAAVARASAAVLARIGAAAARARRDPATVRLVAVTKTVAPDRIRAAVAAGLDLVGENRVQEAVAKRPLVPGATWHLIGPLQSNKARRAVEAFDAIESIDGLGIADRVARISAELRPGRPLPVFLQVNVDADPSKAGLTAATLERDLAEILELPGLRVEGLMTIGRLVSDPRDARPTFAGLRSLGERLRGRHPGLGGGLSMGMTDDFEVAIEEGATHVRIGRAIFGPRL